MKIKQEIIDYASKIADAKTVGRLKLVLDQFRTAEEFFSAAESKGKLMAAYNAAKPVGRRGVGKKFFEAVDSIRLKWEVDEMKAETLGWMKVPSMPMTQPDESLAKPGRFYTVQQLKALVSFMELCGVKAIDLAGIDEFSKVMKFDVFKAMGCEEGGAQ